MHGLSRNILISTAMHGLAAVTVVVVAAAGRGAVVRVPSPSIPVTLVSGSEPRLPATPATPAAVRPAAPKPISRKEAVHRAERTVPPAAVAEIPRPEHQAPTAGARAAGPSVEPRGMSIISGPPVGQPSGGAATTGSGRQAAPSVTMTAAPPAGGGTARVDAIGLIRAAIERAKTYPPAARRRSMEGTVVAEFSISGNGRPADIRITRSSGSRVLDDAAMETIQRAAPFPAMGGIIEVPIVFRLQK